MSKELFTAEAQRTQRGDVKAGGRNRVGERLARTRHIQTNPNVALLFDEYEEDWEKLWYILVRGTAELLSAKELEEQAKARRLLKAKYPNYAAGLLPDGALIIRILPTRITSWGKL